MNSTTSTLPTQRSVFFLSVFYTLAGILPLAWMALVAPTTTFLQSQLLGVFFLSSILSFIAGSHWGIAIITQSPWPIQISIVFSVMPWLIMALKQRYGLEIEALWLCLYIECLLLLMMEWIWAKTYVPTWYLATRTIATALLGLVIALIINKNLYF